MKLLTRDSIRILHVDDDNDFAHLSARGLRRAGFSQPIARYADGLRAVECFSTMKSESAPDVILLDLHLPGKDGLEILHWIRENYREKDVAVYLLTSSEDPAHRRQAAVDGVTDYMIKAVSTAELVQKLDALIMMTNRRVANESRESIPEGLLAIAA